MRGLVLLALLGCWQGAAAQAHSPRECSEGGDFIRNAALSRDRGVSRDAFIGRLEDDLMTIRAFPAPLRWFVHNAGDETFLRTEVAVVFDSPDESERHRAGFLERCAQRSARLSRSSN